MIEFIPVIIIGGCSAVACIYDCFNGNRMEIRNKNRDSVHVMEYVVRTTYQTKKEMPIAQAFDSY